ncbi:LOW QUALITY PROTEIN: tumor necrosis factor receptor superfamily member 5 [Pelodytes ibericus]
MPRVVVIFLLLFFCCFQGLATICSDEEYLKDGRCCKLCRPGFRLITECIEQTETTCQSCESGEFQSKWNRDTTCHQHSYCDTNAGFEQVSEGTAEKDVECRCQNGRHCSSRSCETCVQNTDCGPGHGVIEKATRYSDTQCSPCSHGTFSNFTSDTEQCQPWTRCESFQMEAVPGTNISDVICKPVYGNSTAIYITVLLILLISFGIIYGVCWYKKKKRNKMEIEQFPINNDNVDHKMFNIPEEDLDPVLETTIQGLPVAQEQGKDYHMSQEEM